MVHLRSLLVLMMDVAHWRIAVNIATLFSAWNEHHHNAHIRESWPLDDMKFETLKEQQAKRNPEDLIIDFEDQFGTEADEESHFEDSLVPYASDVAETNMFHEHEEEGEEEEAHADLGGGWGRIIYSPLRRGKQIQMDVCRSTNRGGSEGAFQHVWSPRVKIPLYIIKLAGHFGVTCGPSKLALMKVVCRSIL